MTLQDCCAIGGQAESMVLVHLGHRRHRPKPRVGWDFDDLAARR